MGEKKELWWLRCPFSHSAEEVLSAFSCSGDKAFNAHLEAPGSISGFLHYSSALR